jgi:anti-sigma factor RsiW
MAPIGGTGSLPPDDSHPEFLAHCALATSGVLNANEQKRLREHLSRCTSCRRAMAQYEAIEGTVLPALAVEGPDQAFDNPLSGRSINDAEASLFARLGEEGQRSPISGDPRLETSQSTGSHREADYVTGNTLWCHL